RLLTQAARLTKGRHGAQRTRPLATRPVPHARSLTLNVLSGSSGASVNAQDVSGKSVLHTAVRQGSPMVGLLVDRGASVVCRDSKNGRTPIHIAAELGAKEILEMLLQKCPKGVDIKDGNRMTPLHFAAERGHHNCCQILLRHGASPLARNKLNETALHIAVRNCYKLTCEILLSHEHDLNKQRHNTDSRRSYALRLAKNSMPKRSCSSCWRGGRT
ncbi:ankyrin repeat protein, partial [Penaeus vannamei]